MIGCEEEMRKQHRIGHWAWGRCTTCGARIHGMAQAINHDEKNPSHKVISDWELDGKPEYQEELMVEPVIETYGDEWC